MTNSSIPPAQTPERQAMNGEAKASNEEPLRLGHWSKDDLQRFLEIRQEFFLDPMGSNRERFMEAVTVLQRALFDWYLLPRGKFDGMLALVKSMAAGWSELRKEERRTLQFRRFALNNAAPDLPAVESSVPEHQWQKILGSLGLGLGDPGTFDRFLVQLDEETNPSLRVNHRYLGELLPHDNMVSYMSSITGTFLNENAIIGKVSPCVTHMEEATVQWLLSLIGWDGAICAADTADTVPAQRLPTVALPAERHQAWEREEPTGTIVAGGTIANISALLIARNAVFDYMLGWSGAVHWLGPTLAWELVKEIWDKKRMVVLTSKGAHYSVRKAALQAGVAPGNVIEIAGSENPWILDGHALDQQLQKIEQTDLVIAVVAIAGKTETGYVDRLDQIAKSLNSLKEDGPGALPSFPKVYQRLSAKLEIISGIFKKDSGRLFKKDEAEKAFQAARKVANPDSNDFKGMLDRIERGNEIAGARHNRLFFHVDAAHGGAFLAIPELRRDIFRGIELADTVTIDGHKSFYCYYPCGGLLVRTRRWAQTFSSGHSAYISEEENHGVYPEGRAYGQALKRERDLTVGARLDGNPDYEDDPKQKIDKADLARIQAIYRLTQRPAPSGRSELTHHPFNQYLEGSRGPQGIMQLYFNLATLGLRGYQSILGWTVLLRTRAEEAISLGMSDIRLVTDPPLPADLRANDKQAVIRSAGSSGTSFEKLRDSSGPATVVPISGGRFLRLSAGECNQLLITYIPATEAKLIATASRKYWENKGISWMLDLMSYLWRVNQHLWDEHIYANPNFTYYLGHTTLDLELPSVGQGQPAAGVLAKLFVDWNAWTRQKDGKNPFFEVLVEYAEAAIKSEKADSDSGPEAQLQPKPITSEISLKKYARKFFCHKLIVMHPYTDESLIGDMLRRLAFWGERSVIDVSIADATAKFLLPGP